MHSERRYLGLDCTTLRGWLQPDYSDRGPKEEDFGWMSFLYSPGCTVAGFGSRDMSQDGPLHV